MKGIAILLFVFAHTFAVAGNCVIQGNEKIGDCSNVNISTPKSLIVKSTGSYPNLYSTVTIKSGGKAYLSGMADSVVVERGGALSLSGTARNIEVFGTAEISGTAGFINTHADSKVTISGIASDIVGAGKVIRIKGSIVGGVYTK